MINAKYKKVTKECRCYSCNKDVHKEKYQENFTISIGHLELELCIECGNDLVKNIMRKWSEGV